MKQNLLYNKTHVLLYCVAKKKTLKSMYIFIMNLPALWNPTLHPPPIVFIQKKDASSPSQQQDDSLPPPKENNKKKLSESELAQLSP